MEKQKYRKPRLRQLGSVQELTAGGSGPANENAAQPENRRS